MHHSKASRKGSLSPPYIRLVWGRRGLARTSQYITATLCTCTPIHMQRARYREILSGQPWQHASCSCYGTCSTPVTTPWTPGLQSASCREKRSAEHQHPNPATLLGASRGSSPRRFKHQHGRPMRRRAQHATQRSSADGPPSRSLHGSSGGVRSHRLLPGAPRSRSMQNPQRPEQSKGCSAVHMRVLKEALGTHRGPYRRQVPGCITSPSLPGASAVLADDLRYLRSLVVTSNERSNEKGQDQGPPAVGP